MKNYSLIPTEKIIERLQFENPWWVNNQIPELFNTMQRRLYFDLFYPFVKDRKIKRALVLMGPRRVGKTVMLYHSIDKLLNEGVSPRKIFFVGIDNPIYLNLSLEDILNILKEALSESNLDNSYVFFDEIQYLKNWELHLKTLVDSYPKIKFIVSGSAAAALKWHSTESGAGRFTDFMLPHLTFHEFIHLKNMNHIVYESEIEYSGIKLPYSFTHDIKLFNKEFLNYLNFGGYPEVIFSKKIQDDMGRYIKDDIIEKVLLRDLPSLYGVKDVQELYRFFTYIAYNSGDEFTFEKMSRESGVQKEILKKYLEYLEAAFLIKVLHKVDENSKYFKRISSFKVYLINPSLRTSMFSPIVETDDEMGNMVETAILSQWMHREKMNLRYARWKNGRQEGEVDLVNINNKKQKPYWAVEIKWSNRFYDNPKKLKSLIYFCDNNNLNNALVTTIDKEGVVEVDSLKINYSPVSLYAYNVGLNTLKIKTENSLF